jgi:hypothetical protein
MRLNDITALSLEAYGTSEGVQKAWDTRGRGKKQVPPIPKKFAMRKTITPKQRAVIGDGLAKNYRKLGLTLDKMNDKLGKHEEVRSVFGKMMHFLRHLGEWHQGWREVRDFIMELMFGLWTAQHVLASNGPAIVHAITHVFTTIAPIVHMASTGLMAQGAAGNPSQYGQTGWQYGKRSLAPASGFVPTRSLAGFPTSPRGGHGVKRPQIKMPKPRHTPLGRGTATGMKMHPPKVAKVVRPSVPKVFHPSMPKATLPPQPKMATVKRPHIPSPSLSKSPLSKPPSWSQKTLAGNSETTKSLKGMEGEPIGGAYSTAHIDPAVWFRPPSLTKREKGPAWQHAVPVDQPGEKNNKFLDVDKRNSPDTEDFRMKLLKRSTPGGSPPQIPVRTTLVSPHSAVYIPGPTFASAADLRMNRAVRQRRFTVYGRRGCI